MLSAVHWLRSADGHWYGRDFYEQAEKGCRSAINSKANYMCVKGEIGWNKNNGHPIQEFKGLFMLKATRDFEFFGFRHLSIFYITNGARKDPKKQIRDYMLALRIHNEFFKALKND